jgi:16S rRNA (guanine966-N2)-methyltransferase
MRPTRTLRIIAGRWRGRKFRFPEADIRPTPDRVRETLFNWLQGRLAGARCLDLFAGSGALGLEALSRGAAAAVFVEQQRSACASIEQLLQAWGAADAAGAAETVVICNEALRHLSERAPRAFDLVFLDPPYGSGALGAAAAALQRGWLAGDARIYVERARRDALPALPPSWTELRAGHAGEVGYHLFANQNIGGDR